MEILHDTLPNTAERKQLNTMQEIVMTGKTVEEAVEAACTSLDLNRDEVSYEVIEMPQKRLFGSTLAKVRVYADTDNFSMNDILSPEENSEVDDKDIPIVIEEQKEANILVEVIPEVTKSTETQAQETIAEEENLEVKQEA